MQRNAEKRPRPPQNWTTDKTGWSWIRPFAVVSGGYFGWSAGTLITTSFSYSLTSVVTAAAAWVAPGVGNTVQVSASGVTGSVGDVVWVGGGAGAGQFEITSIVK